MNVDKSSFENELIAALYVSSENMNQAVEFGIRPDWFGTQELGLIYAFLAELAQSKTWTTNSSTNVMIAAGAFERFPWMLDICAEIPDWAFSLDDMGDAFEVIRGTHGVNCLRKAALMISTRASDGDDPFDIAADVMARLEELETIGSSEERTLKQISVDLIALDQKIAAGEPVGLPFPWAELQRRTHGIPFSAVSPLCGRDGQGKSRLATFLAVQWARTGFAGLIFPFEDTELRCLRNASANLGEYDAFSVNNPYVSPTFMGKHIDAAFSVNNPYVSPTFMGKHIDAIGEAVNLPLHICDYSTRIESIVGTIASHKRKYDIDWVIIDGFKDIAASNGENRTQEESRIMRALTSAARKYKVAIIPIMHLNKVADDKWISKQDITGSGDQTKSARNPLEW